LDNYPNLEMFLLLMNMNVIIPLIKSMQRNANQFGTKKFTV